MIGLQGCPRVLTTYPRAMPTTTVTITIAELTPLFLSSPCLRTKTTWILKGDETDCNPSGRDRGLVWLVAAATTIANRVATLTRL